MKKLILAAAIVLLTGCASCDDLFKTIKNGGPDTRMQPPQSQR